MFKDENNYFTRPCRLCSPVDGNCKCNRLTDLFHSVTKVLFELQLFDHLCGDIIVEVLQNKIKEHIEKTSVDNFEETFIESFEKVCNFDCSKTKALQNFRFLLSG